MPLLWRNSSVVSNMFHYHIPVQQSSQIRLYIFKGHILIHSFCCISTKIETSLPQSNFIPDKSQSAVVNGELSEKDISIQPFCPAVLPEKDLSTTPFHLHASVPVHSCVMSREKINSWLLAKTHDHSTSETDRGKKQTDATSCLKKKKKKERKEKERKK